MHIADACQDTLRGRQTKSARDVRQSTDHRRGYQYIFCVRGSRHSGTKRHAAARPDPKEWMAPLGLDTIDAEAGMLSGISRKHKVRSSLNWFAEFCNSKCLSHFAAPFIVVRAETFVAEDLEIMLQTLTIVGKITTAGDRGGYGAHRPMTR